MAWRGHRELRMNLYKLYWILSMTILHDFSLLCSNVSCSLYCEDLVKKCHLLQFVNYPYVCLYYCISLLLSVPQVCNSLWMNGMVFQHISERIDLKSSRWWDLQYRTRFGIFLRFLRCVFLIRCLCDKAYTSFDPGIYRLHHMAVTHDRSFLLW